MSIPVNEIICGRNEVVMADWPDNCIDLTVTSPPYDSLRSYKGYTWDFEATARQLYRVTRPGGVVVWVVADATVDGSETGTSFRQALRFMEIGLKLHDTMIYEKEGLPPHDNDCKRYVSSFEYMFIFSKGSIQTYNPIQDRQNKGAGRATTFTRREPNGLMRVSKPITINEQSTRRNIWRYQRTGEASGHPAPFPEKLAEDHILSWSNAGDIVLDPFVGSGTTPKMAIKHHRQFIGIDISEEYCTLARKRIAAVQPVLFAQEAL